MAGGTDNAEMSIGGMASKLKAAELVTASGDYLLVADGREENILMKKINNFSLFCLNCLILVYFLNKHYFQNHKELHLHKFLHHI